MPEWNQSTVQKHMHVYACDKSEVGHVAEAYQDSFKVHKGLLFTKDRYLPYSAIATIENDRIYLQMGPDEVKDTEWDKRPDYEDHLGDPTQLFYDRGHGVTDPFDETNPNKA